MHGQTHIINVYQPRVRDMTVLVAHKPCKNPFVLGLTLKDQISFPLFLPANPDLFYLSSATVKKMTSLHSGPITVDHFGLENCAEQNLDREFTSEII